MKSTTTVIRAAALACCAFILSSPLPATTAAQDKKVAAAPAAEARAAQRAYVIRYLFLSADREVKLNERPVMPRGEFDALLARLDDNGPDDSKYHAWAFGLRVVKSGETFGNLKLDAPSAGDVEDVKIYAGAYGEDGRSVWLDIDARKEYHLGDRSPHFWSWSVRTRLAVPEGSVAIFGGFKSDEEMEKAIAGGRRPRKKLKPQLLYFAVSAEPAETIDPAP